MVSSLSPKELFGVRVPAGVQQASLAQLVEHLFCKQDVVGSNPTGGSKTPFNDMYLKILQTQKLSTTMK